MHVKHYEKIGRETYIWERMYENRSKWTEYELKEAHKYINEVREEFDQDLIILE